MLRRLAAFLVLLVVLVTACDGDRPVVPVYPLEPPRPWTTAFRGGSNGKLDLPFVIDNSRGMADAQSELARHAPELILALTDPTPDPRTGRTTGFTDVHVGVISSSLGSFGTARCSRCSPRTRTSASAARTSDRGLHAGRGAVSRARLDASPDRKKR